MKFNLKHTINLLSKLVMKNCENTNKNLEEIEFFNWLDDVLNRELPPDVKAICFNLYEDNDNKWAIELVGTSTFDGNNSDWACNEVYTTRENPYVLVKKSDWKTMEDIFTSFLKNYLEVGKYSNTLKNYSGIGIGFVDGDLNIVYKS